MANPAPTILASTPARVVRSVALASSIALFFNGLQSIGIGQPLAGAICLIGAVGAVGCAGLTLQPDRARRSAHYLLALACLVIISAALGGPGYYHGGTIYLLSLGPAAMAMLGKKPGVAWGFTGFLGAALLATAEAQGLIGTEHHANKWIWFDLTDYAVVHALLTAFSLFFVKATRQAADQLARQNVALAEENQQRRAAELEARTATTARGHFLATISHEIRTPMNSILGMASEIGASELVPAQQERLELLERSAKSLLGLLSDLLDYSRLESGKVELEQRPFSIVDLAEEVVRLHRPLVMAPVQLRIALGKLESPTVRGDELRCRQILQNLVSNAIKFTHQGWIELRIETLEPGQLRIEVEDSGPGIAPEQLARLGDPFEQADASTARRHGGTGLGLAIVKRLAEAMGGRLKIASTLGVGSTFSLELPLPAAPLVQEERAPAIGPELGAGLRVLVCEDNVVNQRVILGQLQRLSVSCEIVDNGKGAVDRARAETYAALLLDYQLPDIDGPEVAKAIREAEGTGRHLPIIGLSANAMADDRLTALAAGMDDYLTKPVSIEALRRTLARWTAR